MDKNQIEDILEQARVNFLENEHGLLSNEANERSLTHKFAEYLQIIFGSSWNVDAEYNRYGRDPKIIDEVKGIVGASTKTDEIKTRTIYPDIIVHKRGPDGPNLLIIEAKKDPTPKDRSDDIKKLSAIKNKYHYNFSVFLKFDTGNINISWELN